MLSAADMIFVSKVNAVFERFTSWQRWKRVRRHFLLKSICAFWEEAGLRASYAPGGAHFHASLQDLSLLLKE